MHALVGHVVKSGVGKLRWERVSLTGRPPRKLVSISDSYRSDLARLKGKEAALRLLAMDAAEEGVELVGELRLKGVRALLVVIGIRIG